MFSIGLLLAGCDDAQAVIDDLFHKGTQIGVVRCIERNKKTGIAEDVIVARCREHHQKPIPRAVEGNARYWDVGAFEIEVRNASSNHVVTRVDVNLRHVDNPAGSEVLQFQNLWLEPGVTQKQAVPLGFKPQADRLSHDDGKTWDWELREVYGVDIALR